MGKRCMTPPINRADASGLIPVLPIARVSGMDLMNRRAQPTPATHQRANAAAPGAGAPSGTSDGPPAAGPRLLRRCPACSPVAGPHRGDPVARTPATRRCTASSRQVRSGDVTPGAIRRRHPVYIRASVRKRMSRLVSNSEMPGSQLDRQISTLCGQPRRGGKCPLNIRIRPFTMRCVACSLVRKKAGSPASIRDAIGLSLRNTASRASCIASVKA